MEEKEEINPILNNKFFTLLYIFVVFIVVAGLFYIYIDSNKPVTITDEETATCIAEKSKLYVLDTCGACKEQKKILGDTLGIFNIIECTSNPTACAGITAVPTWIINGEKYIGVQSLKDLKEITGC